MNPHDSEKLVIRWKGRGEEGELFRTALRTWVLRRGGDRHVFTDPEASKWLKEQGYNVAVVAETLVLLE